VQYSDTWYSLTHDSLCRHLHELVRNRLHERGFLVDRFACRGLVDTATHHLPVAIKHLYQGVCNEMEILWRGAGDEGKRVRDIIEGEWDWYRR
jgi:hypothetical protein